MIGNYGRLEVFLLVLKGGRERTYNNDSTCIPLCAPLEAFAHFSGLGSTVLLVPHYQENTRESKYMRCDMQGFGICSYDKFYGFLTTHPLYCLP